MKDTKYIAKVELIEKALEAYKKDLIEKIERLDTGQRFIYIDDIISTIKEG